MLVSAPAFRWLVSHRADTPARSMQGCLPKWRQKVLDAVQGSRIVLAEAALPEVASEEDAEMVLIPPQTRALTLAPLTLVPLMLRSPIGPSSVCHGCWRCPAS